MCQSCALAIRERFEPNEELYTIQGNEFITNSIQSGFLLFTTANNVPRHLCLEHIAILYHHLKVDGKKIDGVGTGLLSVKALIGKYGTLAKCESCELNSNYIWGLLRAYLDLEWGEDAVLKC